MNSAAYHELFIDDLIAEALKWTLAFVERVTSIAEGRRNGMPREIDPVGQFSPKRWETPCNRSNMRISKSLRRGLPKEKMARDE